MRNRRWVRAGDAISASSMVSVMLAMATAGCTTTQQAHETTPPAPGGSSSWGSSDETRGIHPEGARLGLDHALWVRRSRSGVPHELHDGDMVRTGDRIRVSVRTSEDAYLYLAFCAHHELNVYPSQRGIRTRAGEPMVVPPAGVELVLDDDPGQEVLYVILSRTELSLADPRLAQALAAERPGGTPADCGTSLDAKSAKLPSAAEPGTPSSTSVVRGVRVAKKPLPPTDASRGHAPSSAASAHTPAPSAGLSGAQGGPTITEGTLAADPPADPDFERTPGDIVWYRVDGATGPLDVVEADDDGIAVVRHAFTHVAAAPPP